MDSLKKLLDWLKTRSLQQKIGLAAGLAVVLVGLITAVAVSLSISYVPLYYNLAPESAAEVVDYLKRNRIPYKLADSGRTIKVARDEVYEVRLKLAGSQIMRGGVGFEIFDKTNLGVTEFVQNINYQRALQGELTRTIQEIKQVETARVLLVMPKKRLFTEDQEKASASVILKLRLGARLRRDQVEGIMSLVAGSVPGLEPEQVTVLDSFGTILSKNLFRQDDQNSLTVDELNFRHRYESNLEERLQTMLERVIGKRRVVVRVSADLDFNKVEKTEEIFDPDQVAVRSEHRLLEKEGRSAAASGVPGMNSNVPNRQITAGKNTGSATPASSRLDETRNYEISKLVSRTVMPVGAVKKISVAVMVDGKYSKGDGEKKTFVPRSPEEIQIYTSMIKKAIGFNKKRGDQVEVASIAFNNESIQREAEELEKAGRYQMIFMGLKYLAIGLALLFFYFKILKPGMKILVASLEQNDSENETGEEVEGQGDIEGMADQVVEKVEINRPVTIMDQVTEFATQNPEEVAKIVKLWLKGQTASQ